MFNITEKIIKEIAEEMDCGLRCYCHPQSGKLIFRSDSGDDDFTDLEAWIDEDEKGENDNSGCFEIEPMQSSDSFRVMADFAAQLPENEKLKTRLITALNNRKPFANFKLQIDNSGIYRQQWFDYKSERLRGWVKEKLDAERELRFPDAGSKG